MSGLQINASKSELFLPGTTQSHGDQTLEGFPIRSLPIRYLGLPLTTRSMTSSDYAPLLDRIRNRLMGWSSKHLSYAGRLQLIQAVITSMVNFWLSVFRLPKKCLKTIESMCNTFLWSGSLNHTHKSKVSWADVCLPKSEGGLGIRRLEDSSRVYAYSLIWRLLSSSGSLWTKWARRHLIRNHTFWDTPVTNLGSWIWKKMLTYRDTIIDYLKIEIGDGCKASFWYDNWLPQGPLIHTLGATGPSLLGISISSTVFGATSGNQWIISKRRARSHSEVLATIRNHPLPNADRGPDRYLWRHNTNNFKDAFSASSTWDQVRCRKNKVTWSNLIWFPQSIPRSCFISWLACRDRLSTGDRMRLWGQNQSCLLCGEPNETRDHLFFACPYTFTVWSAIAGPILGATIDPDWQITIDSLRNGTFTKTLYILIRLALQVSIDRIWRERNERRHTGKCQTVAHLIQNIDRTIRNRLHSISYQTQSNLRNIMIHWLAGRS